MMLHLPPPLIFILAPILELPSMIHSFKFLLSFKSCEATIRPLTPAPIIAISYINYQPPKKLRDELLLLLLLPKKPLLLLVVVFLPPLDFALLKLFLLLENVDGDL